MFAVYSIDTKDNLGCQTRRRAIEDGDFYTACSLACDTGAITFGDVNIENAEINKKRDDKRMYRLLEDLGTKPNVMYQTLVKNKKDA